jgi:serine/threonine protein kinase
MKSNAQASATDSTLTLRVAELVEQLQAGEEVDLKAICGDSPEQYEQLEMLLPTLQAVVDLEHSLPHVGESLRDSHSSVLRAGATAGLSGSAVLRGSPDPAHPATLDSPPPVTGEGPGEGASSSTGLLGDFRILREIGRGGMGVVYEAEQMSLGRRVALKVLPFAAMLDRQQLARFKNEARAAATLKHPNIVSVYSVGCERSVHFFAMELIEGQSLAEVIAAIRQKSGVEEQRSRGAAGQSRSGVKQQTSSYSTTPPLHSSSGDTAPVARLTTLPAFDSREYYRVIAQLGIQAAEALDHAHQNGILHRDIKPANLLVETGDCPNFCGVRAAKMGLSPSDGLKLWITDFGLARMEQDAGMTMTGDILGTLRYMSPEQALAKRAIVDHRSDIYSLGVTLYELLTLQPAYTATDRQELLRQIAFDEPRKPRQLNARIPHDLETIILKSIEKSPTDRYASAQQLADDIRSFLEHKPIQATRPDFRNRFMKWSRRHPAVISAAAFALVAITVVLAISTLLISRAYQRETAHRQKAEASEQQARINTKQSEEISNFLVAAFQSPDPLRDGKTITMVEVLQRSARDVNEKFADDPATKAKLLMAIGWSLGSLGLTSDAIPLLENAHNLSTNKLGPDHLTTFQSKYRLGRTYYEAGRLDDAISVLEDALALSRPRHATSDFETIKFCVSCMKDLANAYRDAGRLAEARQLFEEAFRFAILKLGRNHEITMLVSAELATVYLGPGKRNEAIRLLEEALQYFQKRYGADHLYTFVAMTHLARAYDVEDPVKAAALDEQVFELRKKKFGPDHPETLKAGHNLATGFMELGRQTEALLLFEQIVELSTAKLGFEHPDTLDHASNLAHCYAWFERWDDSLPLFEKTLALQRAKLKPNDERLRRTLYNAQLAYLCSRDPDRIREAIKMYDEVITGADDNDVFRLNAMAWALATARAQEVRNGARAVELARRGCELTHHQDATLLDTLAVAYAEVGDFGAAVEWSTKAVALTADTATREQLTRHLERFRSKQPWRAGAE